MPQIPPMDPESWQAYGQVDPELETLLTRIPPPKSFADYDSPVHLRTSILSQFADLFAAGIITPVDWTGYIKSSIGIPVRDGTSLRAIVYRPEDREPGALFVYFHGGGWTFGMPEAVENYAEPLVKKLGVSVVSVGYRLAPENTFPVAAYDAIDSLTWCCENAGELRADLGKGFIVAGASAGGNLASVAAHAARVKGRLTGVVLACPVVVCQDGVGAVEEKWRGVLEGEGGSWESCRDAVVLDRRGMEWFYDKYKPDPKSPLASPLLYENHGEQPPTYFQIMGMDPLRDQQLVYEHVLREQGVKTKVTIYAGIPHGATDLLPMLSHAKRAVVDYTEGVEWLLEEGKK